ncbi:MAG: hypothetical protein ING10_17520 [Roseomonas sp.]|nr:hypothetical protein [Roseomonas sp.]
MSAFDGAMVALVADPNMAIAVEWRAAAGAEWRPLRVLFSAPSDPVAALPGLGARATSLEAVLRVADLAPDTPRRGDLLRRLSPAETWRIEEVEPDPLGLTLRLTLARAP